MAFREITDGEAPSNGHGSGCGQTFAVGGRGDQARKKDGARRPTRQATHDRKQPAFGGRRRRYLSSWRLTVDGLRSQEGTPWAGGGGRGVRLPARLLALDMWDPGECGARSAMGSQDSRVIRIPVKASQHQAALPLAELSRPSQDAIAAPGALSVHVAKALRDAERATAPQTSRSGEAGRGLGRTGSPRVRTRSDPAAIESEHRSSVASMLSLLERHDGLSHRVPQSHRQVGARLGVGRSAAPSSSTRRSTGCARSRRPQ